ncbi:GntR family transcriptional regulator [soil metagenome]
MEVRREPIPGVYDGFRTVREIVQRQLTDDIQSGRIAPGEKLREADLAERYGVSRGPVREAVRALEGQGLVRVQPNRGAVVTVLSADELEEIYDILVDLERLALARLRVPVSRAALATLERSFEMMARTADPETWLQHNDEFHLTLCRLGGRERLCRLIADQLGPLRSYAPVYAKEEGRLAEANAEHRRLLDAVASGDVTVLRTLTRTHRLRAKAIIAGALNRRENALVSTSSGARAEDVP